MNPVALEESAKAIGGIVDALKVQPALLVLTLVIVALCALLWYVASARHAELALALANQKALHTLLAGCGK